jgi:hypothetical protein
LISLSGLLRSVLEDVAGLTRPGKRGRAGYLWRDFERSTGAG